LISLILIFYTTAFSLIGLTSDDPSALATLMRSLPPIAEVDPAQITVNEGSVVKLNGSATDPDPTDKLVYSWGQEPGGPPVILNGSDTLNLTFIAPKVSSNTILKFSFAAVDDKNVISNSVIVTVTVKNLNDSPIANAGINQLVNEGYVVSLNGSASKDPDLDQIVYSWIQSSGPAVKLNEATTPSPSFNSPSDLSTDVNLNFKLTVIDDKNASSTDTVKVTIKNIEPIPNQTPIANAGIDQSVNSGSDIRLNGTSSRDPDNDPLSYSWIQTGGPSVRLNGSDTFMATLTAPSNNITSDTDLSFKLAVTDTKNASSTDDVKVTIKYIPPNKPPLANAGQDQIVDPKTDVTVDGSASKDPDGDPVTYSWTQLGGPRVDLKDSAKVAPSFKFTAPDVSSATELIFSLSIKDNKGATSPPDTVAIIVEPIMQGG
jgi:large repetitive protein